MWYGSGSLMWPYTVCVWARSVYQATSALFLMASTTHNFLGIKVIEGRLWIAVDHTQLKSFYNPQLDACVWHHMCFSITNTTAYLFLHNSTFEIDLDRMSYPVVRGEAEDINVQLGDDINDFTGQLADVRFYKRILSLEEMAVMGGCGLGPIDYLTGYSVSVLGEVHNTSQALEDLCRPRSSEFLALFSLRVNQNSSREFCKSLDGRLINRNDNISIISREISKSRDVNDDARLVWTEDTTDGVHGEAIYLIKRTTGDYHRKVLRRASTVFSITACMLPIGKKIYRKVNEVQEFFFYPQRNQVILQSASGDVISKSKCHIEENCLIQKRMGDPVAYSLLKDDHSFLGRKQWRKHSTNTQYTATLTTCGNESFTCDDSQCIDLSMRCDGQPQCTDKSDEGNICSAIEGRLSSYWQLTCPVFRPEIDLYVKLDGVKEITLDKNEFTATLSIMISWKDHRLRFADLNNNIRSINASEVSKIWVPELEFVNARYEDNLHIMTKTGVLEKYMVYAVGKGWSQVIDSYEGTYPGCIPHWNVDNQKIFAVGEDSTISMYGVSHIRFFYNKSSKYKDVMNLRLLFFRRYEAYLLTTFVPCIILYLLSELTLTHFRLDDFTDRITVTLSLLIVIASLFSQVTSSLPSSPAPKFVDWFFFYCILRVSFIFFLHSIIGKRIRARQAPKEAPLSKLGKKAAWDQEAKNPNKKWRFNVPEIINNAGITVISLTDIVALCLFVSWVVYDKRDKTERFHALNVTHLMV
ncbi:Gamma-aminobutyric acid receptor subunit rho-1-like 3, partial [Homarus americanus]